ncbi:translation initiation factor [Fusarium oxysporum f. sp. phaseoli]
MSIENLKTYGESLCYPQEAFSPRFWYSSARLTIATLDPFAEADEDTGETKQTQNYIHIRIQRGIVFAYNANMAPERNGRKTLTTVQGLPKKFDQKKILKVIKKKFACNGTIVNDSEMGEVIQLQGDQRKDVQEFLIDKKEGLELDAKTIKVHGF